MQRRKLKILETCQNQWNLFAGPNWLFWGKNLDSRSVKNISLKAPVDTSAFTEAPGLL